MPQLRDLVIYADDWRFREFLEPYVQQCSHGMRLAPTREAQLDADSIDGNLARGNTIWFDGFSQQLAEITNRTRRDNALVLCRIRGTEFLDADLRACRWEFFDRIVVSNPITADVLRDRFDRIDSHCRIVIVPPVVALPNVEVRGKQKTKRLAYVGPISTSQNAQLLLQCLAAARQQHHDWRLSIIGEFENTSLRIYFEQMLAAMNLAGSIEFNPIDTDLENWYVDKSYFLAPYCSSGLETHVLRAMACGLKPVVHNYFGATRIFDEQYLFSTVREFCSAIGGNGYRPEEYRRQIVEKHDVVARSSSFLDALAEPLPEDRTPKVSVLVPTYNRAPLLKKLLVQLGNQTYANREIVVVDDCSTDDTAEVVRSLLPTRPDIFYHRNEVNQGNAATTGIAASKATGEYLLNCSDDDELDDNALGLLVSHALKKNADLVYCDLMVVDSDGNPTNLWEYRDYYNNYELLRDLINIGRNLIPEVFLVKSELFEKIYTETYARRFLNTYYLPLLRELRMSHLPQPLYRYTVHQGSTFSSTVGLFDRSKSTQNFVNAALFMYSPVAIFGETPDSCGPEQVANAYSKAALILVEHGKRHFAGEIYTGAHFDHDDNLFALHFYNAYHWLEMAHRYGVSIAEYRRLLDVILAVINPREFDPVKYANMPAFYDRLPWFANKPFNNLSQFVALDIVTIGASPCLDQKRYTIHREGKAHVWVSNYVLADVARLDDVMSTNVVTVINLFDRKAIEPTLRYLAEHQLFSIYVLNFTSSMIPPMEMLRNVINLKKQTLDSFEDYLALLTKLTTTEHYAHSHLQTVY
jgi:glycosyltransferase involved in cell wall biosynthesis